MLEVIRTDYVEEEGPFGEFTGYYGMLLDGMQYQYVNGFAYRQPMPVPEDQLPERFALVGSSFGSLVSLAFTLAHPAITSVNAVSSVTRWRPERMTRRSERDTCSSPTISTIRGSSAVPYRASAASAGNQIDQSGR